MSLSITLPTRLDASRVQSAQSSSTRVMNQPAASTQTRLAITTVNASSLRTHEPTTTAPPETSKHTTISGRFIYTYRSSLVETRSPGLGETSVLGSLFVVSNPRGARHTAGFSPGALKQSFESDSPLSHTRFVRLERVHLNAIAVGIKNLQPRWLPFLVLGLSNAGAAQPLARFDHVLRRRELKAEVIGSRQLGGWRSFAQSQQRPLGRREDQ